MSWWQYLQPVTQRQFSALSTKVSKFMAAQDDINAATTALSGVVTDLTSTVQQLANEFAALQNAAGVPVDVKPLEAIVVNLQNVQASIDALAVANAPAAPADPPADPPVVEDPPAV
jgi:hypothetical protein